VFRLSDCRYKNQTVAVKIVNKGENPEEISRREARFAREVDMLSRVQHKNLVKVISEQNLFLFLKYVCVL
jgi:serine/threonine protein kinase